MKTDTHLAPSLATCRPCPRLLMRCSCPPPVPTTTPNALSVLHPVLKANHSPQLLQLSNEHLRHALVPPAQKSLPPLCPLPTLLLTFSSSSISSCRRSMSSPTSSSSRVMASWRFMSYTQKKEESSSNTQFNNNSTARTMNASTYVVYPLRRLGWRSSSALLPPSSDALALPAGTDLDLLIVHRVELLAHSAGGLNVKLLQVYIRKRGIYRNERQTDTTSCMVPGCCCKQMSPQTNTLSKPEGMVTDLP